MVDRRTFLAGALVLAGTTQAIRAAKGRERMGMTRYISFRRPDGTPSFGRISGDVVHDLGAPSAPAWLKDALGGGLAALPLTATHDRAAVRLLPVVPNPGKILCIGLNYATHVAETGREQNEYPAVFTRWADTLVAHGDPIIRPPESARLNYEGELAVIIGKGGRRIRKTDAMAHIAGFSIFNDVSVRDWQRHNIQFTPGKNFPATGAFGPEMVTPEAIVDLAGHRVQTLVNGQMVQNQPVSDMIWDIATLIEYFSTFRELSPGDVIAIGTPGGAATSARHHSTSRPGTGWKCGSARSGACSTRSSTKSDKNTDGERS